MFPQNQMNDLTVDRSNEIEELQNIINQMI